MCPSKSQFSKNIKSLIACIISAETITSSVFMRTEPLSVKAPDTDTQWSPLPLNTGQPAHPAGLLHGQPGPRAFPGCQVEGWRPPTPVRTVITEGHLSPLFPFRQWGKTGNWRKAEATRESRCSQYLDLFTCINIIHSAAALFTK